MFRVGRVMRPNGSRERRARRAAADPDGAGDLTLTPTPRWSAPCLIFERTGLDFVPVVQLAPGDGPPALEGALFHVDALKAYNKALAGHGGGGAFLTE